MAEPRLQDAWQAIHRVYTTQQPGHDAILTCVYRSPQEQALCYAKGRTAPGQIITYCDGTAILSKHNHLPSRALDFCLVIYGKVSWDLAEYAVVGQIAEAAGLVWGGSWARLTDAPHLELKETP